MKLVFFHNAPFFLSKQRHLFEACYKLGHEIHLICPNAHELSNILDNDNYTYTLHTLPFKTKSLNLLNNIFLIYKIYKLFRKIKPDFVFSFSIKPNLYSAIAAKFMKKVQVVPNITGLGYVFIHDSFITKIVIILYRLAFSQLQTVFFQNQDDRQLLVNKKIFNRITQLIVLPGDGVDLTQFSNVGVKDNKTITFLFVARLIWEKGLHELVEAFKLVNKNFPNTQLMVAGDYYFDNPSAVPLEYINQLVNKNIIQYLGHVNNIGDIIASCDCLVLPSYYREGLPRVLLEASSMGKPIITADSVGCRDVVVNNVTGYLVQPRNIDSLFESMIKYILLPFHDKYVMGQAGRRKIEAEFNQDAVIKTYLKIIEGGNRCS